MWLNNDIPKHPYFSQLEIINPIVNKIKNELSSYVLHGLVEFKNQLNIDTSLEKTLKTHWLYWDAAIKSTRYGVIYWLSRSEAKKHITHIEKNKDLINEIGYFLSDNQLQNKLMNYAIHQFVLSKRRNIKFSDEFIPKNAINSVSIDSLVVRKNDFFEKSPIDSLSNKNALYDLHDFAHFTTTTLCPQLYGSYYFSSLSKLPADLKNLIKSPDRKSTSAIPFSDGVVFSELLTDMFDALDYNNLTYDIIVNTMAKKLALFYQNKLPLLHKATGTFLTTQQPISIYQLATLVQNKAYELPASEIEQMIFTRSGDNGHDPLKDLSVFERIQFLATSNTRLYFEKRNTLKHRAHKLSYKMVAQEYLASAKNEKDIELLNMIVDHIDYNDFKKGQRVDLWSELQGLIASA